MMAAIEAARAGAIVTLVEKNSQLGKKLSTTGNGRCNYTNLDMSDQIGGKYRGMHPAFATPALDVLSSEKTISWFREIGVEPRFRGSYVYPNSDQASAVVDALHEELRRLSVKILFDENVKSIQKIEESSPFFLVTCEHAVVKADRVILAAGSKAAPKTGSSGDGYFLARKLGHTVVPYVPALCGICCSGPAFPALAGIRTEASLTLFVDGKCVDAEEGELQLVDYGISGIPVFQLSRYAAYALREEKKTAVYINFLPGFTSERSRNKIKTTGKNVSEAEDEKRVLELQKECVVQLYKERKRRLAGSRMEHFFTGLLNQKLAKVLLQMANVRPELPISALDDKQLCSLASLTFRFKAECIGVKDFTHAQVVAGGVDTAEIDPETMESRLVPGLYFVGEVLDIDGICGGYNLQWAWASGYVAGRHAAAGIHARTMIKESV